MSIIPFDAGCKFTAFLLMKLNGRNFNDQVQREKQFLKIKSWNFQALNLPISSVATIRASSSVSS